MSKLFSRKFLLLFATYAAFVLFFAFGKLSEVTFTGGLLGLSLFYYIANVWQHSIESYTPDMGMIIDKLIEKWRK